MKPDLVKLREAIEVVIEDDHDDGLALAAVIVDRVVGPLHAERDVLKAAIAEARTRVRLHLSEAEGHERAGGMSGLVSAGDLRKILAALSPESHKDAPMACPRCDGSRFEPGTEADGDWDSAAMRHHPYTGEPCTACNGTGKTPAKHIGGRANAEDCPACEGTNPPYPFICPGEPETPGDADA
jgi:hypothetical protein